MFYSLPKFAYRLFHWSDIAATSFLKRAQKVNGSIINKICISQLSLVKNRVCIVLRSSGSCLLSTKFISVGNFAGEKLDHKKYYKLKIGYGISFFIYCYCQIHLFYSFSTHQSWLLIADIYIQTYIDRFAPGYFCSRLWRPAKQGSTPPCLPSPCGVPGQERQAATSFPSPFPFPPSKYKFYFYSPLYY